MISLLSFAKADISAAKSAIKEIEDTSGNEKAMKGIAAYHAQQAIEKITKHLIYKAAPDVNPSKMYTHKIYDLIDIAKSYNIVIPSEIDKNSVMYSDWEATGRYDLHFVVKITSVKKAVSLAEKWIESIEQ